MSKIMKALYEEARQSEQKAPVINETRTLYIGGGVSCDDMVAALAAMRRLYAATPSAVEAIRSKFSKG